MSTCEPSGRCQSGLQTARGRAWGMNDMRTLLMKGGCCPWPAAPDHGQPSTVGQRPRRTNAFRSCGHSAQSHCLAPALRTRTIEVRSHGFPGQGVHGPRDENSRVFTSQLRRGCAQKSPPAWRKSAQHNHTPALGGPERQSVRARGSGDYRRLVWPKPCRYGIPGRRMFGPGR